MVQERKNRSIESEAKRARAISLAQGGTMLKVLPLARKGLTIAEISERVGKSYDAVASSEFHLRKWGDLPSSAREFRRQLAQIIENPPVDFNFRAKLLEMINFDFYRDYSRIFITVSELSRLADIHINSKEISDAVNLLKQVKVPVRTFYIKHKENGEIVYCTYNIILAADRDDGVKALIDGFNFRRPK